MKQEKFYRGLFIFSTLLFLLVCYFGFGKPGWFIMETQAAMTANWTGDGDGTTWNDATNWNIDEVPTSTTIVIIDDATVTVASGQTADFGTLDIGQGTNTSTLILEGNFNSAGSVTIANNGTLEQRNTTQQTLTSDLLIENGGVLTHTSNTVANAYNVNVSAVNITVNAGGSISVDGGGYTGGANNEDGNGPAGGFGQFVTSLAGSGGAHGGDGGVDNEQEGKTTAYCDITNPATIGAGGAGGTSLGINGGNGGGYIRLTASGTLTVNGTVTANGGDGTDASNQGGGGGAGGGVNITADTIAGTPENFSIVGGDGGGAANQVNIYGGGGGGGCALIVYTTANSIDGESIDMYGGDGGSDGVADSQFGGAGAVLIKTGATDGTLYSINKGTDPAYSVADTTQLPASLTVDNLIIASSSFYTVTSSKAFTIDTSDPFVGNPTVTGTLRIAAGGSITTPNNFTISTTTLEFHQSSTWTNDSTLNLTLGNDGWFDQKFFTTSSAAFELATLTIESGGRLTHGQNTTAQEHVVSLSATTVTVESGGQINVDEKGYTGGANNEDGNGPAGGFGQFVTSVAGSGGAHGGDGGVDYEQEGRTTAYCDITDPGTIGAGGAGGTSLGINGGNGGGYIGLTVSGTLTVNGTVTANGGIGVGASNQGGGGGAGGGVNIIAGTIAGTPEEFSIVGGAGGGTSGGIYGGGAGGGCALIAYTTSNSIDGETIDMYGGDGGSDGSNDGQFGGAGVVLIKTDATDGDLYSINNATDFTYSIAETTQLASSLTLDTLFIASSSFYTVTSSKALTLDTTALSGGSATGTLRIVDATLTTPSGLDIDGVTVEFHSSSVWTNSSALDVTIGDSGALNQMYFTTSSPALGLNTLTINDGGILTHGQNTTAQEHVVFVTSTAMTIESGGAIDVDGKGYTGGATLEDGNGPAGGFGIYGSLSAGSGGAHGGDGGADVQGDAGGTAYCTTADPGTIGAGGGGGTSTSGGSGGGLVQLDISGTLTINGIVTADGSDGLRGSSDARSGGGGGGGGINITASTIAGTPESFTFIGGNAGADPPDNGGGGGGGCAALFYTAANSISVDDVTLAGGSGENSGGDGTFSSTQSNVAPSATDPTVTAATDGTGEVSISTQVDDGDDDNLKLKVEYVSGSCTYAGQVTSTLSSTITATFGQGSITLDNNDSNGYQAQAITTASGANTIGLTWESATDVPAADGQYCLFITPNDGIVDGTTVSSTVALDNVAPTAPGALSVSSTSTTSVVLTFGSQTTETNFSEYIIYYKAGSSGVTESDTAVSSSTDANLGSQTYGGAGTATVSGLSTGTQYVFNIWAYDTYNQSTPAGTELTFYTLAEAPGTPTVVASGTTSLGVTLDTGANPSSVEYSLCTTSNGTTCDASGYVQTDGTLGVSADWATATAWGGSGGVEVTGLSINTSYRFLAKARNGDTVETAFSPASAAVYTLAAVPSGVSASVQSSSEFSVSWSVGSNPSGTEFYADIDTGTDCGWVANLTSCTFTGLTASETYSVTVKARNGDSVETAGVTVGATTQDASGGGGGVIPPSPPPPSTDPNNPSGLIVINGGAQYANSLSVTLTFDTNFVSMYAVSDSENFDGKNFLPIVSSVGYTFSPGEGERTVYARFQNQSGTYLAQDIIIVDTIAPAAPVIGELYTGVENGVAVQKPRIEGTAEPFATIRIVREEVDGSVSANSGSVAGNGAGSFVTTADSTGNWSFVFPDVFESGSYLFTVTAQDLAGNISNSAQTSVVISVDSVSPEIIPEVPAAEPSVQPDTAPVDSPEPVFTVEPDAQPETHVILEGLLEMPEKEVLIPVESPEEPEGEVVIDRISPDGSVIIEVEKPPVADKGTNETVRRLQRKVASAVTRTAYLTSDTVRKVINNPRVEKVNKMIIVLVLLVAGLINVLAGFGVSHILTFARYAMGLPMLFIRRRQQKWGVVYDAYTKVPISLATIRIMHAKENIIVGRHVTDTKGRYFFRLHPGSYRIEVERGGYASKSELLSGKKSDGIFDNLYHPGNLLEVTEETPGVIVDIPLDPIVQDRPTKHIIDVYDRNVLQYALSVGILFAGVLSFVITPTFLVGLVVMVLFGCYSLFRIFVGKKTTVREGTIVSSASRKPLAKTVVRVFDTVHDKLVDIIVTDRNGRYGALVGSGVYTVTYDKPGYRVKKKTGLDFLSEEDKEYGGIIARDETLTPKEQTATS